MIGARTRPRLADLALAAAGGLLVTASVPPFGWWPLGLLGIALLERTVRGATRVRAIAAASFVFGIGLYLPSLWWMLGFSLPGGIVVALLESAITALGVALAAGRTRPGSSARAVAVVVGIGIAEVARSHWPFGGVPLGGIDLGQADGPLAPVVAWGGRTLLVVVSAAVGVAVARLATRRGPSPIGTGVAIALVASIAFAHVAPDGTHPADPLRIAVVQGGGPRGERASEAAAARTFAAHRRATARVQGPVDLVVWPEDVIDVDRFAGSPEERLVAAEARRIGAPIVVGIVEDGSPGRFRNASVVVPPDGTGEAGSTASASADSADTPDTADTTDGRFDKVRRVPYGEWFPFRSTIERLGLAELPRRDAEPGVGPGVIATSVGPLAVAISYEAFFPDRARSGVRAGGTVLLVPTNASSYPTSQVPTQQLAAARLRARETGRWVVQAAPTGFSAVLAPDGTVAVHTDLGAAGVLRTSVERRTGLTLAARHGDRPLGTALVVLLAVLLTGPAGLGRARRAVSRATARVRRPSH